MEKTLANINIMEDEDYLALTAEVARKSRDLSGQEAVVGAFVTQTKETINRLDLYRTLL